MRMNFKSQKGSMLIIFALSAVVLIGFTALVTDIGMVTMYKSRLANAVDSAALASAQELIYSSCPIEVRASEYMNNNGFSESFDIDMEDDGTAVRVSASHEVEFGLARILGYNSTRVYATAKAKVLPIISVSEGVRPFAIENQELNFGEQYVLKQGGGSGNSGNYGGIELGGRGASVYYNNIVNGYDGRLMVGDYVNTEPGNMSGPTESGIEHLIDQCSHYPRCTFDHFSPDCPRIITVVIVDSLDVNGRSSVQIIGFASFFLEGVGGSGNRCEVTGRFIRTVLAGETGESEYDFGVYGVRLMQ